MTVHKPKVPSISTTDDEDSPEEKEVKVDVHWKLLGIIISWIWILVVLPLLRPLGHVREGMVHVWIGYRKGDCDPNPDLPSSALSLSGGRRTMKHGTRTRTTCRLHQLPSQCSTAARFGCPTQSFVFQRGQALTLRTQLVQSPFLSLSSARVSLMVMRLLDGVTGGSVLAGVLRELAGGRRGEMVWSTLVSLWKPGNPPHSLSCVLSEPLESGVNMLKLTHYQHCLSDISGPAVISP